MCAGRFLLITLLLVGCATSPRQMISDVKVDDALKHNVDKIFSFRGGGKFLIKVGDQEGSVEALILAEKPGSVRLETGNFLGFPVSVLTMYRGQLTYYQIAHEKFYVGKSHLISKILPFEIEEKDFLGLLFFQKKTVDRFKNHPTLKLSIHELRKDEKLNLYYPGGFKIKHKKKGDYVEVMWEEFDLNVPPFSKELFHLDPPAQADRIVLKSATRLQGVMEDTSQEEIEEGK